MLLYDIKAEMTFQYFIAFHGIPNPEFKHNSSFWFESGIKEDIDLIKTVLATEIKNTHTHRTNCQLAILVISSVY